MQKYSLVAKLYAEIFMYSIFGRIKMFIGQKSVQWERCEFYFAPKIDGPVETTNYISFPSSLAILSFAIWILMFFGIAHDTQIYANCWPQLRRVSRARKIDR